MERKEKPGEALAEREAPVALITGAARRIGAAIAREFHASGHRIVLHCRGSLAEAEALAAELNAARAASAAVLTADLTYIDESRELARQALAAFGRVDVLVNNASNFYATEFGSVDAAQWEDLQGGNLRGHFFLSQALAVELRARGGAIVNLCDIHADRPPPGFSAYALAKAGVKAMTRSLAVELAPEVRVNTISPGAILWPDHLTDESQPGVAEKRREVLASIPLRKMGNPEHIAQLCRFLALEADYVTGQTIRVDGGRFLNLE